ncbi:MAG TPA: sporulation protein YtfJ [Firmicutes bacterium]|nr:sporulation protein YtfJ [Candidatus Fermentithermobacillaceae bacterium]
MAGNHPIENLMKTTMESLKTMVDVNTVVGEPVETKEGTVIIPVSRVSFGFVAGGGDDMSCEDGFGGDQGMAKEAGGGGNPPNLPFAGGSGAGVTVRPVGFLVVGEGKVRFLPVDTRAIYDRLLDAAPELLERLADLVEKRRHGGTADRNGNEEGNGTRGTKGYADE